MKIKLIKELENRTAHFFAKFTTSEVERCKNEGLQFQADNLTMFRGKGNKILITNLYDTVQFSEEGERGQQTNLPIFSGKIEYALDIDAELDDVLNSIRQDMETKALTLEISDVKYTILGQVKLETRNFYIQLDPVASWVHVYRRNVELEAKILPLTVCPFTFHDLYQIMCNHVQVKRNGYTLLYSNRKKLLIFGNNSSFEIDPETI